MVKIMKAQAFKGMTVTVIYAEFISVEYLIVPNAG